ncbi:MAG: uroporphyrinogen-III synthase, partial [Rhodobacteraceae bacterium]|nr:uroporphyrinogen-III synthase [Paracoccaceae bacterium]
MTHHRPPLLLTRPEAAAARFAAAFQAMAGGDWPVVLSPLMDTLWLAPPVDMNGIGGLIFTSETAVRAYGRLQRGHGLPAWCVGARTGEVARTLGFEVRIGPGDAAG